MRASRPLALPLFAALCACDPFGHPPDVGGELGTFHVEATATDNDCGEGALGMTRTWAFDVELSRTARELHWDNGYDVVRGSLGEDGTSFTFETSFVQDMRTEDDPGWLPPCSIERSDAAAGELSSDGDDVASFSGELAYTFAPTGGSDCTDLYGSQGPVFLRLPCTVRYAIDAERTRAPGEDR
jgi:hypothetical protein